MSRARTRASRHLAVLGVTTLVLSLGASTAEAGDQHHDDGRLLARAVLPADTFADGPASGHYLGGAEHNGVTAPFESQPVQGVSALLDNHDGTYWALSDNGYGSLENSADYNLRLYLLAPDFEWSWRGSGEVEVLDHVELSDPDGHIPFAIVNEFTSERVLTGADFDIESVRQTRNGDFWIGDEFGPFLLHVSEDGVLQEAPVPLPDLAAGDGEGELRAPQNPYNEEFSTIRVMNAVRTHAQLNGNDQAPVVSPWHVMVADDDETTGAGGREDPGDTGLAEASSEIHDVASLKAAGYPVVPYTINSADRITELLDLGVDGIISDSSDLLYEAVAAYDADGDGTTGDWILPDGRIDATRIDAQGHRGSRNLRPENTLPAMEVALDNLMTTLETDMGVSADGIGLLDHDPAIEATKCRRADGEDYTEDDEVYLKDLTAAEIQETFVCDRLLEGRDAQTNDRSLSPVAVAFAEERGLIDPYVMPTVDQLFEFVAFYREYYTTGDGAGVDGAEALAANAAEVRYNIETKINPRGEFSHRAVEPQAFVDALAGTITEHGYEARADIQSFDWRTLLLVQEQFPAIRTVYLFGDFPVTATGGGDGTNLQDVDGENTPWLAGLYWPYRVTRLTEPSEVPGSGGFEGMASSRGGRYLYPLLEKPLAGSAERELLIHEFDTSTGEYTGDWWTYPLEDEGSAIGDFTLYSRRSGVVIERDGSQGDLDGFKAVYQIRLGRPGTEVHKELVVDLLDIADPARISEPAARGDVGLGESFAFPFVTIESVVVYNRWTIGVVNDNNYPFSVGRHVGSGAPDDTELIIIRLSEPLQG
jgi:glycerophosphoryl diester phosphodiesterase